MKYYKQMLDVLNSINGKLFVHSPCVENTYLGKSFVELANKEDRNQCFNLMNEAEIFVFESTQDYINEIKWENYDGVPVEQIETLELDLPFKVCFFESLDGPIIYDKEEVSKQDYNPSHTVGLLVHEIAPREYEFFNLSYVPDNCHESIAKQVKHELDKKHPNNNTSLEEIIKSIKQDPMQARNTIWKWETSQWKKAGVWTQIVYRLLQKIKKEETGTQQVSEKVKLKVNGKKTYKRIKQIIRICPKKYTKSAKQLGNHPVDWSHRWSVRGHWRRLDENKLGKNRSGEYVTKGFTWVAEHEKGPENKQLIKKIRIVKSK